MDTLGTQLNRRSLLKAMAGLAGVRYAFAQSAEPPVLTLSSSAGLTVILFASGRYQLIASGYGWIFEGNVNSAIQSVRIAQGADSGHTYQEAAFDHGTARTSAIRLYDAEETALFSTYYGQDSFNADPFPSFDSYPQGLLSFSYAGLWNYGFGALIPQSPWLQYDGQANAVIFSPAANFMTAVSQFADDGSMQGAIDSRIATLPAGFTHRALLAFGHGINTVFDRWGQALTSLSGKQRPANDANTLLGKLSYWTDAGAAYYYHPQDASQYVPVLLQVPPRFDQLSVPIASMELDSWHYQKGSPPSWVNNGSGMAAFTADPTIFPQGLARFQQALGLPLITHARWIAPTSDLRNKYKISGNVAIDPRYWQDYANYMTSCGVEVLEQDWLSGPAVTDFNLTDPDAFLDNMASALEAAGRNIVYCMPLATHLMQSTKYDNVVSARVSRDGFRRTHWDELLFDSRLASAVGLWPYADAFQSGNLKDILVATLTAGPVGSGDDIGSVDGSNLSRAVRADGVIVKPDAPMVPTDAAFLAVAQSDAAPMVASTYTNHAGLRTAYVLAYDRTDGAISAVSFSPESLGVSSPAYVFNYFQNIGRVVEAGAPFTGTVDYSGAYYIVAPIGRSLMAFLGDLNKFVSCGKKRIEQLSDDGAVRVLVRFAPNEKSVTLHFYAPSHPAVTAEEGTAGNPIRVGPQHFSVSVSPGRSSTASVILRLAATHPSPQHR
ncbi:MAG TPA: hypothetical protein VEV17_21095 [Bryobacteraceae bacterium]|nr:hypothetical protein [Bryobacteraceae bacterium]